jgi:dipeptidyl aminopeptidase/acylaminoacyl peptidase
MLKRSLLLVIVLTTLCVSQSTDIKVNNFLVYGPIKVLSPVTGSNEKPDAQILFSDGDNINPIISLLSDRDKWDILSASFLENVSKSSNNFYYAAFYVESKGFTKTDLKVSSRMPYRVFVGNEGKKSNIDAPDSDTNITKTVTVPLNLETGKTLVIIKVLSLAKAEGERELKVTLSRSADLKSELFVSTDDVSYTSFERLLDDPKIQGISISPSGEFSAVTVSKRIKSKATNERAILIFENSTAKQIRTLTVQGFKWVKDDIYAYTTSGTKTTSIHSSSIKKGEVTTILDGVENFASFFFSTDGKKLIYSIYKEVSEFENGAKRHKGLQDRWDSWRNTYKTFMMDLTSGTSSVLINFDDNLQVEDLSDDNNRLLLSRSDYDLKTRPFSYSDYFIYNFSTEKLDSLFRVFYGGNATFSKDGKSIYLTGGPALFGNLGVTTEPDLIPNDYNSLLYKYEISSGTVSCLTKEFDPAISDYYPDVNNEGIFLLTTDKSYKNIYLRSGAGAFTKIDMPVKSVENLSFDDDFGYALLSGSDPDRPDRVYLYDLKKKTSSLLYDPNAETYKNIKPGKYEEFSFVSDKGRNIECALFFPPDYDPTKNYPCIVNYYGGTTPVSNTFEGRYPKNIWTANGYIVLVLQPSGAIGYGQKFAAFHVNDWGGDVAQEIIQGTKKMLDKYPSVDPKRLGCIGASYGGFMTMSLVTKTDIFAAAISHAGISSLSSYWGEGFWGPVYSAVATANSYPWNRKDIYVDKSPLFSADKVNTPILLLHGNDDTNVPPGESLQFYTALKILGRDVEFIEIDKQNHHILDYDKRKHWSKTILAYFDKYLKKDSSWWNFLYESSEK